MLRRSYNIALRETVGRQVRRVRPAADGYTQSTGNSTVTPYVGTWAEVEVMMDEVCGALRDAYQVTCEATGIDGGLAELRVTEELYEFASSSGGGGDGGDGGAEGAGDLGTAGNPEYTGTSYLVNQPLLSHEKFKDLTEDEVRALKALMDGHDENDLIRDGESDTGGRMIKDFLKSSAAQKAAEYIKKGITTYVCVQVEASASWEGGSNSYKSGTIISSPPGNVVSTPEGCNWMVGAVKKTRSGSTVRWGVDFVCSAPGGYDSWLYTS